MRRCAAETARLRCHRLARLGAPVVAVAIAAGGCAAGTSMVASSAYRKASVYGTATAYVRLAPNDAFEPAMQALAEMQDIEITALDQASTRCSADAGDREVTFRVFESEVGRSRLSVLVGGGDDPVANQQLANRLMQQICGHFDVTCE